MNKPLPGTTATEVPRSISIATSIKGFLLWLGGSLAGVTALLYACGYLVTRAHLHMLGLYGFVEFDNNRFLHEGAKFVVSVAYDLAGIALIVFAMAAMVFVPALGLWLAGRRRLHPLLERIGRWSELEHGQHALRTIRGAIYVVLLGILIWLAGNSLDPFYAPLCVADLLFSSGGTNECSGEPAQLSTTLRTALLSANSERLVDYFGDRLSQVVYFVLLACIAWQVVARWRWRGWLIAPFLVSMGLFLLLLPMDYGVLRRPTMYPVVNLQATGDAKGDSFGTVFLLDKTDNEVVLWDSASRKVVWLPNSNLAKAEIVRIDDLFRLPAPVPSQGGRK